MCVTLSIVPCLLVCLFDSIHVSLGVEMKTIFSFFSILGKMLQTIRRYVRSCVSSFLIIVTVVTMGGSKITHPEVFWVWMLTYCLVRVESLHGCFMFSSSTSNHQLTAGGLSLTSLFTGGFPMWISCLPHTRMSCHVSNPKLVSQSEAETELMPPPAERKPVIKDDFRDVQWPGNNELLLRSLRWSWLITLWEKFTPWYGGVYG